MKTKSADLFLPELSVDAICLTTNGTIKKDGSCVMGRGVARWAVILWPGIESELGNVLKRGNIIHDLGERKFKNGHTCRVLSFPVKHQWFETADINLIIQSSNQLLSYSTRQQFKDVWLPTPGCGNGKLSWKLVEPEISKILDDRFTIIFKEGEAGNE